MCIETSNEKQNGIEMTVFSEMKSPVTGSGNVRLVKTLRKKVIVSDYLAKMNVDVSRFYDQIGDRLNVYQCDDTGFKFYRPAELAGDGDFYDAIVNDGEYYSSWKKEYEFGRGIATAIDAQNVLDVGCGSGHFIEEVGKSTNAIGLEMSTSAAELGKEKGLDIRNESIEVHSAENAGHYDLVCAFQVLEHVPNVSEFLNQLIRCLKIGGSLILSVPNCEPYFAGNHWYGISNLPPHHMGLWNLDVFSQLPNYFPLRLETSDHDHQLSLQKICASSGISMAKHYYPEIGNGLMAKFVAAMLGVLHVPRLMLPGQSNMRFARVMVHFTRTE